jgi:hypothetical protein
MKQLAIIAALVALATSASSYGKEQSRGECIRDLQATFGMGLAQAKRICDPRNNVKPNEFGWICQVDGPKEAGPYPKYHREKGSGARLKRDAVCE